MLFQRTFDPDFCDMECLEIKSRLTEALLNRDKDKFTVPLNDTGPPEVQEGKGKWKGACYLGECWIYEWSQNKLVNKPDAEENISE